MPYWIAPFFRKSHRALYMDKGFRSGFSTSIHVPAAAQDKSSALPVLVQLLRASGVSRLAHVPPAVTKAAISIGRIVHATAVQCTTTEGGQANPVFFLQKSFHSFGDGSSREAGQYVRVTDEGVTADARGRPWGPWGGTCPTPGQNNGDFIPWHALSAYSRDTAPRFWR